MPAATLVDDDTAGNGTAESVLSPSFFYSAW